MTNPGREEKRGIRKQAGRGRKPEEVFPEFDDPAHSSEAPGSPVTVPARADPPKDIQYAGHPEFSQDAAWDEPLVRKGEDKDKPGRSGLQREQN